jgi:hypothetical protein
MERKGWRRTAERADPISEGLTLQIYAELLRAEAEAGIDISPAILEAIPDQLTRLYEGNPNAAYDMGEYTVTFTNHQNREELGNEGINFLWHPWAIRRRGALAGPVKTVSGAAFASGRSAASAWLVVSG